MHKNDRAYFDEQLEIVLDELPALVKFWIGKVPLVVEDFPSRRLCDKLKLQSPDELLGLYVGQSLDKQTVEATGQPSDVVYLFRLGIMRQSEEENGDILLETLREEIRKTIVHEYGHHNGMDEDELEELGY